MKSQKGINDVNKLTLGELMDILKRVKIKILISILLSVLALFYGTFKAGQIYQLKETAVALGYPFKMSLFKEAVSNILRSDAEDNVNLGTLNLAVNDAYPRSQEDIGFTLHKINDRDKTDIRQIGFIVSQKCKIKDVLSTLFGFLALVKSAYADSNQFEWHSHDKNLRFQEKYFDKNTVRRYYDDGWVLEYKLDKKGKSIPSSFKWIKKA